MSKESILNFITDRRTILTIVTILVTFIIYQIIKKIINIKIQKINNSDKKDKKKQTYLKLFNNVFKYLFLIIDVIVILQIYGINIASIVAGLGIVSVITGLALQDAFKDIIAGFNILMDSYFSIGDVIKIEDVEGKVVEINLKVTKLIDINNENKLVIANRNIVKALRISNQLDIDIPIPYEENIAKVEEVLDDIIELVSKNEKIEDIKYVGINQFGDSAIFYKLRLWCEPEAKPQIKRDVLTIIKLKLDENNITIPYTQIDIHSK